MKNIILLFIAIFSIQIITIGQNLSIELLSSETTPEFSVNKTTINLGEVIQFADLSANNPIGWIWTFEGADDNKSYAKNPQVTYNTEGRFDVTLITITPDGTDTLMIENYITVAIGRSTDGKARMRIGPLIGVRS